MFALKVTFVPVHIVVAEAAIVTDAGTGVISPIATSPNVLRPLTANEVAVDVPVIPTFQAVPS